MDARRLRAAALAAAVLVSMGAKHRTPNFIIETADPRLAAQVGEAAERFRHDLAVAWLGKAMPNWSQPCLMTVQFGQHLGAGGATTFVFDRGEVFGWRMSIQGPVERVFDSVLPHEITHMIFASHFRQPLPRWADEGGATSVEHASERNKHRQMLYQFLRSGRGIAFNKLFAMKDYPPDIMPLYAQGYSVADYLIQTGGRRKYVEFVGDGLQSNDWAGAVRRHYGLHDLNAMQDTWLAWVREGSPALRARPEQPGGPMQPTQLAAAPAPRPGTGTVPISVAGGHKNGTVPFSPATDTEIRTGPSTSIYAVGTRAAATAAPAAAAWPAANDPRRSPPPLTNAAPSSGWRAAEGAAPPPACVGAAGGSCPAVAAEASPPAPPAVDPFSTQAARPQPFERPREIILEWSRP